MRSEEEGPDGNPRALPMWVVEPRFMGIFAPSSDSSSMGSRRGGHEEIYTYIKLKNNNNNNNKALFVEEELKGDRGVARAWRER